MTIGLESRRAIVGAIVGLMYGSALKLLSIFAADGGHGSPIPLWLTSAPFGAFGLVAWRVAASEFADSSAAFQSAARMGSGWDFGGAFETAETYPGFAAVAVYVCARARRYDRLSVCRSQSDTARRVGDDLRRCVGARLPRGTGGVVVATNEAKSALTCRLAIAPRRPSRLHATSGQLALPGFAERLFESLGKRFDLVGFQQHGNARAPRTSSGLCVTSG